MKRKDLNDGILIDPGIYLLQGEENDPEARVVKGPFPNNDEGKAAARSIGEQLSARGGGAHCLVAVIELPR